MNHPLNKNITLLCLLTFQAVFSSYLLPHAMKNKIPVSEGFAVVELFTSEGCSSCPPADEAVGRLNGWKNNVYVLSFHVDYWDYLGWKDNFSSPAYSKRQQEYGSIFHLNSIYTPQIIVNGKIQFVGNEETRLRETIEAELKEAPVYEIDLKVQSANKNQVLISCSTSTDKDLTLNLALVQNMSRDFIQRGENKGKNLMHYFTVRDFQVFPNQKNSNLVYLNIPTGMRAVDCTIVAFLQNPNSGHILAATHASIP